MRSSARRQVLFPKRLELPDPFVVERCLRLPGFGPRLLFFSGGTALADLSRELIRYSHNSFHLITPFDSGGSSAEIRRHFNMLAVGDLRHRLMALADPSIKGNPDVSRLFVTRLSKEANQEALKMELESMSKGRHERVRPIPDPMRKLVRHHLVYFYAAMPEEFHLQGASLGNLILVGGFLNNHRQIDPVLYLFARLAQSLGVVRPSTTLDLHLKAVLENGQEVIGQHLLTGKEAPPLKSPIRGLSLVDAKGNLKGPKIKDKVKKLIQDAELICYPMGSFFSSLCSHFLIEGMGKVIAKSQVPKVYIPNLGHDPEQLGYGIPDQIAKMLELLQASGPVTGSLLDFVLVDRSQGLYQNPQWQRLKEVKGIQVLDVDLVDPACKT